MAITDMIQEFIDSEHGQGATQALQQAGISDDQIQSVLSTAGQAGVDHVEEAHKSTSFFGENPGKSFFAAFASGLIKGDGVFGSLEDGAAGVLIGRITDALQSKLGLDSSLADAAAAATAPYVVAFLKTKISG